PFGLVVFLALPGPIAELSQYYTDVSNAVMTDGILPGEPTGAITSIGLLASMLMFGYQTVMVALKGATLGKLALGMRVLQVNAAPGTNPSWVVSALRAAAAGVLGRIPIVNIIDPLVMLFTKRKQTLHDMLARTIVYKK
ncbi:MAG: RDD family protein, partial [Arachnia sp.]